MTSDGEPVLDGLNTDGLDANATESMIRVTVETDVADLVCDRFWQLGVRAVSEIDLADGRVEISSSVGNDLTAIERATATFDAAWEFRIDEVASGPADEWRAHSVPITYRPRKTMVPAWLGRDLGLGHDIEPGTLVTFVEPASAFGLGDHPTTKGSMALLADALERRDTTSSMIDVGCGTGVLAVLAAQLDVPTVRAIDVAEAAVSATRHNALLNGVDGLIDVDTTPLADVAGPFDVVVANILAPVLISLADDLRRVTAMDGSLIISGILEDRHDHVLAALAPMRPVRSETEAGWITIELQHPTSLS